MAQEEKDLREEIGGLLDILNLNTRIYWGNYQRIIEQTKVIIDKSPNPELTLLQIKQFVNLLHDFGEVFS